MQCSGAEETVQSDTAVEVGFPVLSECSFPHLSVFGLYISSGACTHVRNVSADIAHRNSKNMARRILILGIPAIAAYGIYTTNRLLAEYPIRAVSTYHQSPEIIPTLRQAKDFGRVEVIYARVPLKADCTSVGQK